ncbi:hypothetical protein D046_8899, partial [Vibrio parahaemolyticus V-223/04]
CAHLPCNANAYYPNLNDASAHWATMHGRDPVIET